ncbi:MAG: hypothetical protein KC447_04535 [Rhodobacteraceae bacterium]|nr:hypothetical protein [Paracoccaceae bacterium]
MENEIVTTEELAKRLRYDSATSAFRVWMKQIGAKPLPGRKGYWDIAHVQHRLNIVQGLATMPQSSSAQKSSSTFVEIRRARLGKT